MRDNRGNINNNNGFRVVCVAPSTLQGQSWQVGICRACEGEFRPGPAIALFEGVSENHVGQLAW